MMYLCFMLQFVLMNSMFDVFTKGLLFSLKSKFSHDDVGTVLIT